MSLRIAYERAEDLAAQLAEELPHGGLFVRTPPPEGLDRGMTIDLEIETPNGRAVLPVTVIQVIPGVGLAVTIDPAHPALAALVGAEKKEPTLADKIKLALLGDRDQRLALLRDTNKMFAGYVLKNPKIQLDEVLFVARLQTVSTEALTFIAGRREWIQRPEIAAALARNPKTPVPLAVSLLDRVSPEDLRQIAKVPGIREAVQRAARKKLFGF